MKKSQAQNEDKTERFVPFPEQAQRLSKFRDWTRLSKPDMARTVGEEYKTYQNYEGGKRKIGPDCRKALFKLGLNLNWLDTEEGPMTLPVQELMPGTIGGEGFSLNPNERHRTIQQAIVHNGPQVQDKPDLPWEVVRRAVIMVEEELKGRMPMRPESKAVVILVTGRDLLVLQGRGEHIVREKLRDLFDSMAEKAEEVLKDIETTTLPRSNPP